jgi:hypothetical protein
MLKTGKLKSQWLVIYNLIQMTRSLIFIKLSLNKIQTINNQTRIQCQIKIMEVQLIRLILLEQPSSKYGVMVM